MQFIFNNRRVIFSQRHISPNELHIKRLKVRLRGLQILMNKPNVSREQLIRKPVRLVQHDENQIEPGQKRRRQINIFMRGELLIIPPIKRVRRGQNRGPGVERGNHPHLGDRNGLLLHDLVDRGPVVLAHFVELVDAADAHVRQNQRAALERDFPGVGVLHDRRREPHARTSLAGRVDPPRGNVRDVLQELALRDSRVPDQGDVDVAPDFHPVLHLEGVASDFSLIPNIYSSGAEAPFSRPRARISPGRSNAPICCTSQRGSFASSARRFCSSCPR